MDALSAVETAGIRPPKSWRVGAHYLPCPKCRRGPHDDRLTLWVRDDGHANWVCNRCGWLGNTWTCASCGKPEKACRCDELYWNPKKEPGGPSRQARQQPPPPKVEPTPPSGEAAPRTPYGAEHEVFWDSCREITPGDPAGRYLAGRCCALPDPAADLRWLPDYLHHHVDYTGPCIVGRITHALTGLPQSFHFTWLRGDGGGKATVEKPRLLAPGMRKSEGVIRLSDPGDPNGWLLVGEGIETVLSGWSEARHRVAWATIDACGLGKMPIPDWLRDIFVLVDHDELKSGHRRGQEAAEELARRLVGYEVVWDFAIPDVEGWDWNNVAMTAAASTAEKARMVA